MSNLNYRDYRMPARFFDSFFDTRGYNTPTSQSYNVVASDKNYTIIVPIPGAKKENINVSLNGNRLTVEAKSELDFGLQSFNQTFRLKNSVSYDNISATYEEGVLRVVVENPQEEKPSSVQIPIL